MRGPGQRPDWSAVQVGAPTMPVRVSPTALWYCRAARRVLGPKTPSMVTVVCIRAVRARCALRTQGPVDPIRTGLVVPAAISAVHAYFAIEDSSPFKPRDALNARLAAPV